MDQYAVFGNPIAHSRSPFIHQWFAKETGQDMDYARVLVPPGGLEAALRDFAARGGRGCNITVPFKLEVPALAARRTERVALAGAANTLRLDAENDGGWLADNTDGTGLVRDIEVNAQVPLSGRRVLLVGAGGAAAGALGPLLDARPAEVVVANRTLRRAAELVGHHAEHAAARRVALSAAPADDCGANYDVVVNATSSSLQRAPVPVGAEVLGEDALALDMMYGIAAEPFLAWAAEHGAAARDGLGMLVEQAADAFALWRGVRPETAALLEALRDQLATD